MKFLIFSRIECEISIIFKDKVWNFYYFQSPEPMLLSFTKLENKQDNLTNLYPWTKCYFREKCKSQNINPIYVNLKFTFGIIQIKRNACQVCLSA